MNAYNPLDSMKRLETAGLERRQAEAIAGEINHVARDLVTNDCLKDRLDSLEGRLDTKLSAMESRLDAKMDATLSRQLVRFGGLMAALLTLAGTIVGVISAIR